MGYFIIYCFINVNVKILNIYKEKKYLACAIKKYYIGMFLLRECIELVGSITLTQLYRVDHCNYKLWI